MKHQPITDVRMIKKYPNRRLYDTELSKYVTLEHLAQLVRDRRRFQVIDKGTGTDITRDTLLQVLRASEASREQPTLPIERINELIARA